LKNAFKHQARHFITVSIILYYLKPHSRLYVGHRDESRRVDLKFCIQEFLNDINYKEWHVF